MDEDQANPRPPATITPLDELRADPIIRALVGLEEQVRREVDRHKKRADLAESRLADARTEIAEAHDEIARLTKQLEEARAEGTGANDRLVKGLADYLEESVRAQEALITVTRHVLGVKTRADVDRALALLGPIQPAPDVASGDLLRRSQKLGEAIQEGFKPSSSQRSEPGLQLAQNGVHRLSGNGVAKATENAPADLTSEHELIDLSNQADMERLNARSRMTMSTPSFRLRKL